MDPEASVMVIDDCCYMLKIIKNVFQEMNIACDYAVNGFRGLELLDSRLNMMQQDKEVKPIKIIFLDYDMPALDGCQTAGCIQELYK